MHLRAATRGSALARWQTDHVIALLHAAHPDLQVEVVVVETEGDRRLDVAIHQLGGRGVFVKEVQEAVLDGRADVAVHSAKDLPSERPTGLAIAAIPERADPRDALVGARLQDLPAGAHVATGSVRRRAQLAGLRPDLTFADLRGNIDTRLAKAAHFDAVVMAAAALERLDRRPEVVDRLDPSLVVPQVGQGALAVECRADAPDIAAVLAAVDDQPSRRAVTAERAFLSEVGGGCDLPIGAHAVLGPGEAITVHAVLASLDGHVVLRHEASGTEPDELGRSVARHLLDDAGGAGLLAAAGAR